MPFVVLIGPAEASKLVKLPVISGIFYNIQLRLSGPLSGKIPAFWLKTPQEVFPLES